MLAIDECDRKLMEEIKRLKQERNAVILAHLYQRPEVQEVADIVGDSLELSRRAAEVVADVIVFCGVHFMAESAAILSPEKIVLLPELKAGCPMADMVTAEALRAKKQELPNAVVVAYVNTSAEVKGESDICCTSANAIKIIQSIPPEKEIIFIPDRNLGEYVATKTGRPMILWEGWCNTHDKVNPTDILEAKKAYPDAPVLVHPECRPEITALADFIGSTSAIIKFARESEQGEFIVGTEMGILHQLNKQCPDKKFHLATEKLICPNMKVTNLEKVKRALETMQPQVKVAPEVRKRALASLERMLAIK